MRLYRLVYLCRYFTLAWVFLGFITVNAQGTHFEFGRVSVSPNEQMVAGAASDGLLRIWDANTGSVLADLQSPDPNHAPPISLAWKPDSTQIAIGDGNFNLKIYCVDLRTHPDCTFSTLISEVTPRQGLRGPVNSLAWNNDGRLFSNSIDDPINSRLWDSNNGFELITDALGPLSLSSVWHPNQNKLYVGNDLGIFVLNGDLDLSTISSISTLRLYDIPTMSMAWHPDGIQLAVGTPISDNTGLASVHIINTQTQTITQTFTGQESEVFALAWSPDGDKIASAGRDDTIRIWDIETGSMSVIPATKSIVATVEIAWTTTTGLIFPTNTGIVGLGPNQAPSANAGTDQQIVDSDGNGTESVTLNASNSTDDVIITTFEWYEDNMMIATGVNPSVDLAVGVHEITLVVTDDDGATDTDEVVITVKAPAGD